MALTFAKGEKVIKQYDYSKSISGKVNGLITHSRLIITNMRIVEESVCYAKKNERLVRSELPLEKAQKVASTFKRRGNALWLMLAFLSAVLAAIGFILTTVMDKMLYVGIVGAVALVGFILLYIFLRKSVVTIFIGTDTLITPVMYLSSTSKSRFGVRQIDLAEVVRVIVDPTVAMQMVDDLGAALLDAKNYVAEPEVVAKPEVTAEPEVVAAPEVVVPELEAESEVPVETEAPVADAEISEEVKEDETSAE